MGRLNDAGRRLALGTGRLLYGIEDALDSSTGWGALGRIAAAVSGVLFVDALILRSPVLVYALPVVWVVAAWRVSDSSAAPPPPSSGDVYAGHSDEIERVQEGPGEGMSIIYPVREEMNET